MGGAAMLQYMKMPDFSGMPAAAPYFFISRWSVVRSIGRFCFDRNIGPGNGPRMVCLEVGYRLARPPPF